MKDKSKRLIPDSQVCRRYGIVAYTLWRWDHDPDSDFPKPLRINKRKYRVEDELDEFDARRAAERDACLDQPRPTPQLRKAASASA
jgi:predicted DNA-binding transcriptional regulator AlpA